MEKYLYLTEPGWVNAWIEGGPVPFKVASEYLRDDRDAIYTPDENLIDSSTHDVKTFFPYISVDENADMKDCTFSINHEGIQLVSGAVINRVHEDGLVVCMSNSASRDVCRRFKKVACVKIKNVKRLRRVIDKHLGVTGEMGKCRYTKTHHRDHFLKYYEDSWQDEFRMFWKNMPATEVMLPKGMATLEFILS